MYRAFKHTCEHCKYLGTNVDLVPPFPGGDGPVLLPRVDFYRCAVSPEVDYIARYGNGEQDIVGAAASDVDDWRLVPMVRGDPDSQDALMRLMIKIIRLVDKHGRLDLGYSLIRLEDRPTDPFLLTLPYLMPHEQTLVLEVSAPLMAQARGLARNRGIMRSLDEEIQRRLVETASENGYITIWNKHGFVPPMADEEKGPPN